MNVITRPQPTLTATRNPLHGATLVPLFGTSIAAGFASPADDFIEQRLDVNAFLIEHPAATFFMRAEGDSMQRHGIYSGDVLVVDRAAVPKRNSIVVAIIEGELALKRLDRRTPGIDIWGVVTSIIRKM